MADQIVAYAFVGLILFLIVTAMARIGRRLAQWFDRPRRRAEHESRMRALEISDIDSMDGLSFEHYVARLLRHEGYYGVEVTRGSGDFGVDIVASKNGRRFAIQVKRQAQTVSRRAVSDAVAGKPYFSCDAAMVITNNFLSRRAKKFASTIGCEIVERDSLSRWILRYQNANLRRSRSMEPRSGKTPYRYVSVGALCLLVIAVVGWSWSNRWKGNNESSYRSSSTPATRGDGQANFQSLSSTEEEIRAWNRIRHLRRGAAHFEAFLEDFPEGRFAVAARRRLTEVLALESQRQLGAEPPSTLTESPTKEKPTHSANDVADPEEARAWNRIRHLRRGAAHFEAFLEEYPDGRFAVVARRRLTELLAPESQRQPGVEPPNTSAESTTIEKSANDKRLLRTGRAYVTADRLNVRLAPELSGKIADVLHHGQKVDVLELQGQWARISRYYDGSIEDLSGGVARWVAIEHLSDSGPAY